MPSNPFALVASSLMQLCLVFVDLGAFSGGYHSLSTITAVQQFDVSVCGSDRATHSSQPATSLSQLQQLTSLDNEHFYGAGPGLLASIGALRQLRDLHLQCYIYMQEELGSFLAALPPTPSALNVIGESLCTGTNAPCVSHLTALQRLRLRHLMRVMLAGCEDVMLEAAQQHRNRLQLVSRKRCQCATATSTQPTGAAATCASSLWETQLC